MRARASIYSYRDPPGELGPWVLGLVDWPDGTRALDVGCGPGSYLALLRAQCPEVRGIGVDLSPGMASEAARHAPAVNADVACLPLTDDCIDRVLAPHMLYHCPDIPAAIAEVRRVLRPGGALVAVTNGRDHLRELWDVYTAVTGDHPDFFVDRFDLDNGEGQLRGVFDHVRVERYRGALLVPDAEPLVDYLASTVHFYDDGAEGRLAEIRARIQRMIDGDGGFRIRTHSGAFVCR